MVFLHCSSLYLLTYYLGCLQIPVVTLAYMSQPTSLYRVPGDELLQLNRHPWYLLTHAGRGVEGVYLNL